MTYRGPHWITCPYCGEKRDTSGRYTSPANQRRDRLNWVRDHESGACTPTPPTDKI